MLGYDTALNQPGQVFTGTYHLVGHDPSEFMFFKKQAVHVCKTDPIICTLIHQDSDQLYKVICTCTYGGITRMMSCTQPI